MQPIVILSFEDALRATADGKQLLVRRPVQGTPTAAGGWTQWAIQRNNPNGVLLCRSYQYGVAPKTQRYRRYLAYYQHGDLHRVWTHNEGAPSPESAHYFVRWIDDDWQSVEVC